VRRRNGERKGVTATVDGCGRRAGGNGEERRREREMRGGIVGAKKLLKSFGGGKSRHRFDQPLSRQQLKIARSTQMTNQTNYRIKEKEHNNSKVAPRLTTRLIQTRPKILLKIEVVEV
jgi:hypothetical protein